MKDIEAKDGEAIVVCLPTSRGNPDGFDDNRFGECACCGDRIQWRPHMPAGLKICTGCLVRRVEMSDEICITPETRTEMAAFLDSRTPGRKAPKAGPES